MTTYTVYHVCDSARDVETGLTPAQVVQHIYRDDGQNYRLDPRMEMATDDDGKELGEQQVRGKFGLEWDVYFPRNGQEFGPKSRLTAYGETEDEAEAEFLDGAWRGQRWDVTKWCVITDEQRASELAQARAEQGDE